PRISPPEEVIAADLRERHGESVLRIEVRAGPGDGVRVLAVLDLGPDALAAEAERQRSRDGGVQAEVIDRATWLALRRLVSSGIMGVVGGAPRVLHTAAEFASDTPPGDASTAQAAEWRGEAERTVRMAGVLAAGGFPEEVPPLLAKALRHIVAARQLATGEGPADPLLSDPEQIRAFVGSSLPTTNVEALLQALRLGAGAPTVTDAADLARTVDRLITALWPDPTPTAVDRATSRDALVA
ncbi:MAG TPA: hypothetical protein VE309_11415, partial [Caulobacteraceae bacterium]|nr:hypothetical protein [Caulobacteraceae bacterium]